MKPSEDLHRLIHSLHPNEKWYFKLYAGRNTKGGDANYIRLFDAIDKQKEYDEQALKKQFSGEKFAKQIAVTKTYLYNMVMESLEIHHGKQSVQQKINRMVYRVEILFHKRLFDQAWKLLQRARKLADHHELELPYLRLVMWQQQLVNDYVPARQRDKVFDELGQQEEELLEGFKHTAGYMRLMRKLNWHINRYGAPRNLKELEKFKPIFEHPFMQDEANAKTIRAKCFFNIIKADDHMMHHDTEKAYGCYKKIIELVDAHPEQVSESHSIYLTNYITHSYNLLSTAVALRRFDDYFEYRLQKLMHLDKNKLTEGKLPENVQIRAFVMSRSILLRRCIAEANFDEGLKVIADIEAGIRRLKLGYDAIMISEIYINGGLFYFYRGDYGTALQWFGKILNDSQSYTRQDIYGWLKILTLIIHLELGHERILEYGIKSTYLYLLRKERLHRSEKLLLQFLKKDIVYVRDENSLTEALKKLYKALEKLSKSPFEAHILQQFDLLAWLESRIEGRPLPEIIKAKAS